jgi:hypothetical protein
LRKLVRDLVATAVEVVGDLAGGLGQAGAAHGQGEIALGPHGEAVVGPVRGSAEAMGHQDV